LIYHDKQKLIARQPSPTKKGSGSSQPEHPGYKNVP